MKSSHCLLCMLLLSVSCTADNSPSSSNSEYSLNFQETNPYDISENLACYAQNTNALNSCLLGIALPLEIHGETIEYGTFKDCRGILRASSSHRKIPIPNERQRILMARRYIESGADPNASLTEEHCAFFNISSNDYSIGDSVPVVALKSGYRSLAFELLNITNGLLSVSEATRKHLAECSYNQTILRYGDLLKESKGDHE